MGVLDDLGYAYPKDTWWSRALAVVTSSRIGARLFQPTAHRLDRLVLRLTGGRQSASSIVLRLPVLTVTCTGRKSGLPRTFLLFGIPVDDSVALIGTNLGQAATPSWVHNLLAEPRARISYRDRSAEVVARLATAEEFERAFEVGARIYGGYAKYRERIANREIRVFLLEKA